MARVAVDDTSTVLLVSGDFCVQVGIQLITQKDVHVSLNARGMPVAVTVLSADFLVILTTTVR